MEINNRNIWFLIPIVFNLITLICWIQYPFVDSRNMTGIGLLAGITGVLDFGLLFYLFLMCTHDDIKFSFKISIPFQHYFKDKKARKEIDSQILKLKIDLGRTPIDHTWKTNEIVKKIEILQAEKYNKYGENN
jgi:hypothetical protein